MGSFFGKRELFLTLYSMQKIVFSDFKVQINLHDIILPLLFSHVDHCEGVHLSLVSILPGLLHLLQSPPPSVRREQEQEF